MPQFDPSVYVVQFVWLAICFVALYVLMAMVALPRIGSVLEERQRRIDDNLDKAQRMKAEAEEVAQQYELTLAKARSQAAEIFNEGAGKVAAEAGIRQKALAAKLEGVIKSGEARIAEAKNKALAEVRSVATDVTQSIAVKLTGIAVESAEAAAAVDQVVKERH